MSALSNLKVITKSRLDMGLALGFPAARSAVAVTADADWRAF